MSHHLAIIPLFRPVVPRNWKVDEEKRIFIDEEVEKLYNTRFITDTKNPNWLANMVIVRQDNHKWHMCVDFTNLNDAFPKNPYPFPDINRLTDRSSGYQMHDFFYFFLYIIFLMKMQCYVMYAF